MINKSSADISSSDIKSLLRQSLVQRFLISRFLRFTYEQGIPGLLSSLQHFTLEKAADAFCNELGYIIHDRTIFRMVKVLMDILNECGVIHAENGVYSWAGDKGIKPLLSYDEAETINSLFYGQIVFFDRCLDYTAGFLTGSPPLYSFEDKSVSVWEEFLGNPEYSFARSILLDLLFAGKNGNSSVLDLCYGPGFDILQMQEQYPCAEITALDFKNIFYDKAADRAADSKAVKWTSSDLWKGFGTPLPFNDNAFDIVFFACADPYIPDTLREYVYNDIFRVLRHGGSLGILSHSYPDKDKLYVKDALTRKAILCHDFAESVCEGWYGFNYAAASVNIFKKIGYSIDTVMLNSSVWRLDKP